MDAASVAGDAAAPAHTAGSQPSQPPQPARQPFRVLMVCTANQVRSAMAERMLRHALAEVAPQLPVAVSGAGTRTIDGLLIFPEAAAELELRGIDASGFRSHALIDSDVRQADVVLTATREHRSDVLERVPLALKRAFTLLEFAALVEVVPADLPAGIMPPRAGGDPGGAGFPVGIGSLAGSGFPVGTGSLAGSGDPGEALRALVRRAAAQRGAAAIADDEYDVADPAGLPEDEYRYAARLIEYATAVIARAFARAVR